MLDILMRIEWRQPMWLVLTLLPFAVWLLERRTRNSLLNYAAPHLRNWAILDSGASRRPLGYTLKLLLWVLLAVSLAGPRWPVWLDKQSATPAITRGDVSYVVVLDISTAMQVADLSTTRRQRARTEINDLLDRLRGERIGLVVFGTGAGLLSPPTDDYDAFRFYLAHSDGVVGKHEENALPNALRIAAQTLSQTRYDRHAVILVTAGDSRILNGSAGANVLAETDRLRRQNIPLYVLGVANRDSDISTAPDVDTDRQQSGTQVDHRRLAELANLTDGAFTNVANGNRDWRVLYDSGLATLPSSYRPLRVQRTHRELYPWFLLAALIFLLARPILFNVRHFTTVTTACAVVGLVIIMVPRTSQAGPSEKNAYQAFIQKDYALAQVLYNRLNGFAARMGEGASAYHREDFLHARDQFTLALLFAEDDLQRADALYNRGNSLFRLKHFTQAKEAFRDTLVYNPGHQAASINLELTTSVLQQLKDTARVDPDLPGRRASEEYGRSYDPAEEDFPEDEPTGQLANTARQQDALGQRVARGEIVPQAEPDTRSAKTQLVFSDAERAASRKKMELVSDNVVRLLQALITDEQTEITEP